MNSPAIAHLFQKQTKPSNCRGEKKTQQLPCDLEDFGAQIAPQFVGKITLNRSKSFPRKDSQPFDPPQKNGSQNPIPPGPDSLTYFTTTNLGWRDYSVGKGCLEKFTTHLVQASLFTPIPSISKSTAECGAQVLQTKRPQRRQWCRRLKRPKATLQPGTIQQANINLGAHASSWHHSWRFFCQVFGCGFFFGKSHRI